jgi:putative endonuclease
MWMARRLLPCETVSHERVRLGEIGENLACQELERRGYSVVARRYRRRGGEIDIIALDGATLVFVEVKARAGRDYGLAAESVTAIKRRRLTAVALDYVVRHHVHNCPCRFDVVAIQLTDEGAEIELFQNAFAVTG